MDDKSFDNVADSGMSAKKSISKSKMEEDNRVENDAAIDVATAETGVKTFPNSIRGSESAFEIYVGRELDSECKDGTSCTTTVVMLENAWTVASNVAFKPDDGNSNINSFINNCGRLAKNCGMEARVLEALFKALIISPMTLPTKGIDPARLSSS